MSKTTDFPFSLLRYCEFCGGLLNFRISDGGFNMVTGDKVKRVEYKCPDYHFLLRRKHTKMKSGTYALVTIKESDKMSLGLLGKLLNGGWVSGRELERPTAK